MSGALDGLLVLDLTRFLSGPYCTLLLRLAGQADVLVENFRPGVAARLGIDYPVLQQHNARLVHCAITGYGATGPDRHLKSYDLMAQAASGLMGITGEPDGPPMKIGSAFSDMLAGTYAALAIVAAVHERARSGTGALAAGLPFRYSRSASDHRRPAPVPGGDTQTLLTSMLGLSDDEFAALRRDGVV